jgi:methionyl-tRNA formyltransferase
MATLKTASAPPSITFFGTGPVSLASLEALSQTFPIEAVVTKPDFSSPSGKPLAPLVKTWAIQNQVPFFQPSNKSELTALLQTRRFNSPAGVVVDYGLIIPQEVISAFPLGIVNSHFSLLPQWRGPDPITAALLSGQSETGVSLMLIVPQLDEGPLIAQQKYSIPKDATIFSLTEGLISLSNKMLQTIVPLYITDRIAPHPQDLNLSVTYSRKLTKSDGTIDWTKPSARLEREIRAYLGWPGSRTELFNKAVTITQAHVTKPPENQSLKPGQVILLPKNQLGVMSGDNLLVIDELKPAGRPSMSGSAFLSGIRPNRTNEHYPLTS